MRHHFIDNQWVPGITGESIAVIDPSTGDTFDHLARGNADDIDKAVKSARRSFEGAWGALTAAERGRLLMKLAYKLQDQAE
jgi:aldehyde dehydrogenase (NAD+)